MEEEEEERRERREKRRKKKKDKQDKSSRARSSSNTEEGAATKEQRVVGGSEETDKKRGGHLGTDNISWGMDGDAGLTTHGKSTTWFNAKVEGLQKSERSSARAHRVRVRSGDTVTVVLDSDLGTLSYWVNGVDYGVAFLDVRLRRSCVRPS